jgi:hypothetical protein
MHLLQRVTLLVYLSTYVEYSRPLPVQTSEKSGRGTCPQLLRPPCPLHPPIFTGQSAACQLSILPKVLVRPQLFPSPLLLHYQNMLRKKSIGIGYPNRLIASRTPSLFRQVYCDVNQVPQADKILSSRLLFVISQRNSSAGNHTMINLGPTQQRMKRPLHVEDYLVLIRLSRN